MSEILEETLEEDSAVAFPQNCSHLIPHRVVCMQYLTKVAKLFTKLPEVTILQGDTVET